MIKDVSELHECPDCASENIVLSKNREQLICRECGLIFEPLTPEVEEQFERSHELVVSAASAKKAVKKVTAKKAKPKKAAKAKRRKR